MQLALQEVKSTVVAMVVVPCCERLASAAGENASECIGARCKRAFCRLCQSTNYGGHPESPIVLLPGGLGQKLRAFYCDIKANFERLNGANFPSFPPTTIICHPTPGGHRRP